MRQLQYRSDVLDDCLTGAEFVPAPSWRITLSASGTWAWREGVRGRFRFRTVGKCLRRKRKRKRNGNGNKELGNPILADQRNFPGKPSPCRPSPAIGSRWTSGRGNRERKGLHHVSVFVAS